MSPASNKNMSTATKKNKSASAQRSPQGKPRKQAAPLWRRGWLRSVMVILLLAGMAGSGWWTVSSGLFDTVMETTRKHGLAISIKIGLRVDEVLVVGRQNAERPELLRALNITRGEAILAFDVEQARQRVEALPWVRGASVERLLPDTILLTVEERAPLALWQYNGRFSLIDYEGHVILRKGLGRYSDYMVVVGKDAPRHAADLMEMLDSQPELMALVRAAIRVGGRRWNLRLAGGIDVQLPEDDMPSAWLRLAQYQRSHSVLDRDVSIVDLRLPDRLIVRRTPQDKIVILNLGQET